VFSTVRLFIKTGLGFLFFGLALGAVLLTRREIGGSFPDPYVVSAHVHAVGVGFVMFMILGVALWLFPRAPKDDTRYRPGWILTSYWILTLSTALRIAGELFHFSVQGYWLRVVVLAAGLGQIVGLAIYFYSMWPRIRPVGSHLREAQGERF
jgi:heme/copper-type cytochrome/quinol oxidase subunit 1